MTAYLEGDQIDTSHIEYSKTGIRLPKFVKTVYGDEVFENIEKGLLMLSLNNNPINDNFSNHRVHENTEIMVDIDDEIIFQLSDILHKLKEVSPKNWEENIEGMIYSIKECGEIA